MPESTWIVNTSEEQPTIAPRSRLFRIIQPLERSPAVSYIIDPSHRIIHCNPAWISLPTKMARLS
jgi:PAS domain-containing protein